MNSQFTNKEWIQGVDRIVKDPLTNRSIVAKTIDCGGYGHILIIDETNEPDGNFKLLVSALRMYQFLEGIRVLFIRNSYIETAKNITEFFKTFFK